MSGTVPSVNVGRIHNDIFVGCSKQGLHVLVVDFVLNEMVDNIYGKRFISKIMEDVAIC